MMCPRPKRWLVLNMPSPSVTIRMRTRGDRSHGRKTSNSSLSRRKCCSFIRRGSFASGGNGRGQRPWRRQRLRGHGTSSQHDHRPRLGRPSLSELSSNNLSGSRSPAPGSAQRRRPVLDEQQARHGARRTADRARHQEAAVRCYVEGLEAEPARGWACSSVAAERLLDRASLRGGPEGSSRFLPAARARGTRPRM